MHAMIAAFVLFTAAFADSEPRHEFIDRDSTRLPVREPVRAEDSVPVRLVVEEGKYGEVLIPMRSIQNAELHVSVPKGVMLTWEPGVLQYPYVSFSDGKKLYEFAVLDDGRDNVLLRVSGSPTEGTIQVSSAGHTIQEASLVVEQRQRPSEGVTQAEIVKVKYRQTSNIRLSDTVDNVARVFRFRRQRPCAAGGRCYGISTMWIKDKVEPTFPLKDADKKFFSKLKKLRREWTDAAIVQNNQRRLKNALKQEAEQGRSRRLNAYDHPYYVRARLDPHQPGGANLEIFTNLEISSSHLVNWMTRDGHLEVAYMTVPQHAMALAYYHSTDTISGKHSLAFFDPNVGTITFSHEDIEIMKDAVIRYFENELAELIRLAGLTVEDKVVVRVQKVPRDKFINIVNDLVVKYLSNNP